MRYVIPTDINDLGKYLPRFLSIVDEELWLRRVNHLEKEMNKSFFMWKIISDYHWLEMAIAFQSDVLAKEGRLLPELIDELILTALRFAATCVEMHAQLSVKGRLLFEGRLRDGLKAENGYAPLYLELDLAQRLMNSGYDVTLVDIEGIAQFDFLFTRGTFEGEIECKSISADAGRQIHRKDFYRFMEAITPALEGQRNLLLQEVLLITLKRRLSPNIIDQAALLTATRFMLQNGATASLQEDTFKLERHLFADIFSETAKIDTKEFYKTCGTIFGPNPHVAGALTTDGGCIVVMRSEREDDTSKAMLSALKKAASQFSGTRPAFIAIQEHGLEATDLTLTHIHRRAGILSYALFGRYGATHVNATYVTGFGAVVAHNGRIATPAFAIPNPNPRFPVADSDAELLYAVQPDSAGSSETDGPLADFTTFYLPIDQPDAEGSTR